MEVKATKSLSAHDREAHMACPLAASSSEQDTHLHPLTYLMGVLSPVLLSHPAKQILFSLSFYF